MTIMDQDQNTQAVHLMIYSIHTDDIDGIGSTDEVLETFELVAGKIWELKRTDQNFMMGVERIPEYKDDRLIAITHKMTAFAIGAAQAFNEYLPKKTVNTPFPPKLILSKDTPSSEEEISRNIDRGYQRAVGLILWGVRRCSDEGRLGVSFLGSMMSRPSDSAWEAAMHMLKWILQECNRGIRFSIDGNEDPIGFSDASNKPVMSTGLCQGGYNIMWLDGPLCSGSQRLRHVGLSSEHNEYMAMTMMIKKIVWLRQLLKELGFELTDPTMIFADNVQANKLVKEHFISPGNQYIACEYHFNKEKHDSGDIKVHWTPSGQNISDMTTKALEAPTIKYLLPYLTGFAPDGIKGLVQKIKELNTSSK